jgi:signal transduction histidine kinase
LRAPLRAVQSHLQIFLEDYGPKIDDEARAILEKVIGAAQRMDRMVLELLTFTRLSHEPVAIARVDIEKLVREIIRDRTEFQSPNATITVDNPLLPVMGNEVSLNQCLINLLDNAVKFVEAGTVSRVRIYTEPKGDMVRLWIEDNGIGISAEHQAQLFRMFQRVARRDYPGTGIGLAIVRKAIERMGGSAGIESEVGEGSRFWLELPRATS